MYKIPTDSEYQLADILTKGLQLAQFERSLYSLLEAVVKTQKH